MTLIKTRRLVRDLRWKTIKSWQKLRGIHKQSNWGPVFTKGAYQKRCVFNEAVELLKSVFPSTFFQNFQCCNNGFKFGIRVEKDTIMTLWVYWHVKSLTCFNVYIYALSIKSCLLFYSFIYDIHFWWRERGNIVFSFMLIFTPQISSYHIYPYFTFHLYFLFYYCIYRFTYVSPFTSIFVLHFCSSFPN
jgi:hypothetical protein